MSTRGVFSLLAAFALMWRGLAAEPGLHEEELIFPPDHWHVHASCVVEAPNGDLIVCWFQGSGERKSDDVKIEGARLKKGSRKWSDRFVMADTPGYPDTNCALFVDPQGRLWLFWPTILANTWESSLLKLRISSDWLGDGPPKWDREEVVHITPGAAFNDAVQKWLDVLEKTPAIQDYEEDGRKGSDWLAGMRSYSTNRLNQRLGWMTRAHPFLLEQKRLIVPLYSDGFSFSLMAITDDWGKSWHTSSPLLGLGNIQPSIVRRNDGTLYTLMRDNGPPPKRLLQSESKDRGETWSEVTDSPFPNSGAGSEIIRLANGHWVLINNDLEDGRHRLLVQISEDEGKTWPWKRYLENSTFKGDKFHYPSLMQAADGTLHATYSHHLERPHLPKDVDGDPAAKTIKHVRFNEAWVQAGEARPEARFELRDQDVVAFLGGSDVAAAQQTGHLEALLTARHAGLNLRFRNFGWEGDTVYAQPRDINFPPLSDHLKKADASLLILQYGRMEAMLGRGRLAEFKAAYEALLDQLAVVTPRMALVTPPPFEGAPKPLPDLRGRNAELAEYAAVIRALAAARGLPVIDLFAALEKETDLRRTADGLQLTPQGHSLVAAAFARQAGLVSLAEKAGPADRNGVWPNAGFEQLRRSIIAKNRLWFDAWRPQNWAFLGGDRVEQPSSRDHRDPKIRWFPEEMKQFAGLIAATESEIREKSTTAK